MKEIVLADWLQHKIGRFLKASFVRDELMKLFSSAGVCIYIYGKAHKFKLKVIFLSSI